MRRSLQWHGDVASEVRAGVCQKGHCASNWIRRCVLWRDLSLRVHAYLGAFTWYTLKVADWLGLVPYRPLSVPAHRSAFHVDDFFGSFSLSLRLTLTSQRRCAAFRVAAGGNCVRRGSSPMPGRLITLPRTPIRHPTRTLLKTGPTLPLCESKDVGTQRLQPQGRRN
eukprot:g82159.t1